MQANAAYGNVYDIEDAMLTWRGTGQLRCNPCAAQSGQYPGSFTERVRYLNSSEHPLEHDSICRLDPLEQMNSTGAIVEQHIVQRLGETARGNIRLAKPQPRRRDAIFGVPRWRSFLRPWGRRLTIGYFSHERIFSARYVRRFDAPTARTA